jgi:hypothetical protein
MRALVFDQSLSLDPRRAEPTPADGDTLIKVRQAGICATDLEITKGYMSYRGVLGMSSLARSSVRPIEISSASVWWGRSTSFAGDATCA